MGAVMAVGVAVLAGLGVYAGFNYQNWRRAEAKIAQLPGGKQAEAWGELAGYDPARMAGGILAWAGLDRVWVWTRAGLKSFVTDEYSVYSWFDGCNERVLAELNAGVAGAIGREIETEMAKWRKKVKAGDYVRVYLTNAEMGGREGNLREVYAYNFWLFLPLGMEERCAK
jgi:hypothetical protein